MLSGYYFQVQPRESEDYFSGNMLCTGMYMPYPDTLKSIREEVLYNGEPLEEAIVKARGFSLDTGRNMKRVPNGYPKDHPYSEFFKQRDWLLVKEVGDRQLYDPNLVEWVLEEFKKTKVGRELRSCFRIANCHLSEIATLVLMRKKQPDLPSS